MSISSKYPNTQTFRLMVYRRALHPELFELQERRLHRHGDYETETWLWQAGHAVRFQTEGNCLTETVIENGDHLPEHGLVHALPCLGEKDFELDSEKMGYVTTIQTEALTDNLYMATYREMLDFAVGNGSLFHEWSNETGAPSLSMLDVQKFKREFHLQSYHLIGSNSIVLRTQSIFEIK